MSTRREFIKIGGAACVAACSIGVILSALESCKPSQVAHVTVSNSQITVPLESFATKKVVIVNNMNLEDNVAVIKKSDTEFVALLLQCTHRENEVKYTGSEFYCPSHGSTFDMDGNVTKQPAIRPLKRYPASLVGNNVIIKLS
jgi:Rieske Fe-S protein